MSSSYQYSSSWVVSRHFSTTQIFVNVPKIEIIGIESSSYDQLEEQHIIIRHGPVSVLRGNHGSRQKGVVIYLEMRLFVIRILKWLNLSFSSSIRLRSCRKNIIKVTYSLYIGLTSFIALKLRNLLLHQSFS